MNLPFQKQIFYHILFLEKFARLIDLTYFCPAFDHKGYILEISFCRIVVEKYNKMKMKINPNKESRRSFIKKAAIFSAAVPTILTSVKGRTKAAPVKFAPANERVNLAVCGIGNRGSEVISAFARTGLCNFVAFADVDMGGENTVETLERYPNVRRFQDFREMFDKMGNEIDAVAAIVPDHAHYPISITAMQLGKHIFTEKPLGRTFRENELLIQAAKKYPKVVTQMCNQGHSGPNFFQFKAWTEAGIIKDVTAISAHMNNWRRWHDFDPTIKSMPPGEPIPSTLDWYNWVMAANYHPYNKHAYVHGQWRCWYDYGMGALGDWGAHIIDTAHRFLNLGLPYEVTPLKIDRHNPFFYPMASTLLFRFARRGDMPPCDITWYDGVDNLPPIPPGYGVVGLDPNIPPPSAGTLGEARLNPGKIIYSNTLTFKGGSHASTLSIIPDEKAREMESRLPVVPRYQSDLPENVHHFENFLKACKGEEQAQSPFEISAPLSQVFSLGVIAQRLNEKIEFNASRNEITNNRMANDLLSPPPRKGWEQYYRI